MSLIEWSQIPDREPQPQQSDSKANRNDFNESLKREHREYHRAAIDRFKIELDPSTYGSVLVEDLAARHEKHVDFKVHAKNLKTGTVETFPIEGKTDTYSSGFAAFEWIGATSNLAAFPRGKHLTESVSHTFVVGNVQAYLKGELSGYANAGLLAAPLGPLHRTSFVAPAMNKAYWLETFSLQIFARRQYDRWPMVCVYNKDKWDRDYCSVCSLIPYETIDREIASGGIRGSVRELKRA